VICSSDRKYQSIMMRLSGPGADIGCIDF